jgi:hypothetical protein
MIMKRKILSFILIFAMCVSLGVPVFAVKVGDTIGDVLYSDITAYINGSAIPTSVIQGKTLVVVEDLAKYGFDVKWDGAAKTLKVTPNEKRKIEPIAVTKDTKNKPGTIKTKYLYTDIKTYLSGDIVESYAISGVTLIDFELLSRYGKLNWNGQTREIHVVIDEIGSASGAPATPSAPSGSGGSGSGANIDKSNLMNVEQCHELLAALCYEDNDFTMACPYPWTHYRIRSENTKSGEDKLVVVVYNFDNYPNYENNKYAFWILPPGFTGMVGQSEEGMIYVEAVFVDGVKYVTVDSVWEALVKYGIKKL